MLTAGDIVRPHREEPIRSQPWFTGMLVSMVNGRPVIVNTLRVPWDSVGLVLDVRIGRRGSEGGEHNDALVLFPCGLCRVPEGYLCTVIS